MKNKSYTYMLPLVSNGIVGITNNLVNVYIGDREYPELREHLFLHYKFSGDEKFLKFEEELRLHPLFKVAYDPDPQHTMFVLKVPEQYLTDLQLFKQSKYSHISSDSKTRILAYHNLTEEGPVGQVLYKKEPAFLRLEAMINDGIDFKNHIHIPRSQEASGLLNLKEEIFNERHKWKASIEPNVSFLAKAVPLELH